MKKLIVFIIRLYKIFISPILTLLFGQGCKYSPTCSTYAINSINKYGVIKGGSLAIKRLLSCQSLVHINFKKSV